MGIPHIYDSPSFFDDIEYDDSEYPQECINTDINEIEYEELCLKIKEHLIEEKALFEMIKRMELI